MSIKPIMDMRETMKIIKPVMALKDSWVNEPGLSMGYFLYCIMTKKRTVSIILKYEQTHKLSYTEVDRRISTCRLSFVFCFFFMWVQFNFVRQRVSLSRPGYPGTCYVT